MNYQKVIKYLYSQLPVYQRAGKAAYKKDLKNILALSEHLGNPHKKLRAIHVAGTNGKGSVSHILSSVLQEAGYNVGLYTSPHLKDFRERIRINGEPVPEDYIVNFMVKNMPAVEKIKPSFFEITVGMAFRYFAEADVDLAVIETGLGGRLDSTNILTPWLSIITNIAYDHQNMLGESLLEIAAEKAGIIKPNVPVVVGESRDESLRVFTRKAEELNAPIYLADYVYSADYSFLSPDYTQQLFNIYKGGTLCFEGLKTDLIGFYQKKNIITALQAIEVLQGGIDISEQSIYKGIAKVKRNSGFAGRWQILGANPMIVADTAHNESGLLEVLKQIESIPHKNLHIVIGLVNDKNTKGLLNLLPKNAEYYFTKADIPRALNEKLLSQIAGDYNLRGNSYERVGEAVLAAREKAQAQDFIFVGGSTFVVAEVV